MEKGNPVDRTGSGSTRTSHHKVGTLNAIRLCFRRRPFKLIALFSGVAYALFYMFFTGIISVSSEAIPADIPVPWSMVVSNGLDPIAVAYLNRYTIFVMSLEALLVLALISTLVGMNAAMIVYRFRVSKLANCQCGGRSASLATAGAIVPGLFSTFACCGAGIITAVFGAGIIGSLLPFNGAFASVSAFALLLATMLNGRSIIRVGTAPSGS